MSLPDITLASAVKRQYRILMQTVGQSFYRNLIYLELFFIALSLTISPSSHTTSYSNLSIIQVIDMSASQPLWAAVLYLVLMAFVLADKSYRDIAFTFVSSRLSHHLATIATIVSLSGICAAIGTLSMVFSRVLAALLFAHPILYNGFIIAPKDLLICALSAFSYGLLCSSIVYLVMIIARRAPKVLLAIPLLLIVCTVVTMLSSPLVRSTNGTILGFRLETPGDWLIAIVTFYTSESSILLLLLKTLVTAGLLFAAAIVTGRRLEVRR